MVENPAGRIKAFWDGFADEYERTAMTNTSLLYRLLVPLLKLNTATCVVEAGCGPGNGLNILRENLQVTVKILANDLSDNMVSKTQSRLLENVDVILGNNEELPYSDEICDRYIANLSLHLVNDPAKMLKESIRLLKPNGIAAFTVWGKAEENNMFTIMGRGSANAGIVPQGRSPFHLNNNLELNNLLIQAGYSEVKSFYTAVACDIFTPEEFLDLAKNTPGIIELKEQAPEQYNLVLEQIRLEAAKVLDSGKLITFDALIATGVKA